MRCLGGSLPFQSNCTMTKGLTRTKVKMSFDLNLPQPLIRAHFRHRKSSAWNPFVTSNFEWWSPMQLLILDRSMHHRLTSLPKVSYDHVSNKMWILMYVDGYMDTVSRLLSSNFYQYHTNVIKQACIAIVIRIWFDLSWCICTKIDYFAFFYFATNIHFIPLNFYFCWAIACSAWHTCVPFTIHSFDDSSMLFTLAFNTQNWTFPSSHLARNSTWNFGRSRIYFPLQRRRLSMDWTIQWLSVDHILVARIRLTFPPLESVSGHCYPPR